MPIGSGRFDLYTEPADETLSTGAAQASAGFWRRQVRQLHRTWQQTAQAAQATRVADAGRLARARDWLIRRIAESIAEQRTLWSLRNLMTASFVYPANLSDASAAAARTNLLTRARQHHGRWLLVNVALVAVTAILVLLPGPNLIGYYFAFRVVGHFLSWRGASQALDQITWQPLAEPALTELGALADLPRDQRAERVAVIGDRLGLPRLATFFDRVAAGAS